MRETSCKRCGAQILPDYSFCMNCGAPVSEVDSGTSELPSVGGGKKYKLLLIRGDGGQTASYALGGTEHVAGRDEGIILFPEDDTVSPAHARFFYNEGRLFVKDLGSTNGTFVRLTAPVQVKRDDRIICGEQLFLFDEGTTVEPEADTDGTYFFGTPISNWYFRLTQVLKGGRPGAVHVARKPKVTIGRENCDFSFPDDKFMSHKHSVVEHRDSACWLSDAGSRNGTFLMLRDAEERVLNEGDYLFIGRQLIKVAL
jgi:pSer/pThr/pTyr-binding forkhead associated (FHA) protein